MGVLAASLAVVLVGSHEVLLRDGEEARVLGARDELAGAAHGIERVIRGRGGAKAVVGGKVGCAVAGASEHLLGLGGLGALLGGKRPLGGRERDLLLARELVGGVGRGLGEGVGGLGDAVGGHVGKPQLGVDLRLAVVAREVEGRAIRLDGVIRTAKRHEAGTKLEKGAGRVRVRLVDGGASPGGAGLEGLATLGVEISERLIGLVGRGVARVGDGSLEAALGLGVVAGGDERAAPVAVERAHVAVRSVSEGLTVGLGGLGEHAELHEGVAAQVVRLAADLAGALDAGKS